MDDLISSCQAFITYKILPYAGGWMDQPAWWIRWLQGVYIPGLNRAKFDGLKPEEKAHWQHPPKKIEIPPDMEW